MIPFHNALSIDPGEAGDYGKFLAMISGMFPEGPALVENTQVAQFQPAKRVVAPEVNAYAGTMWGTPRSWYTRDSAAMRFIQHCAEDTQALAAMAGRQIVVNGGLEWGEDFTTGQNINGYNSLSYSQYSCLYNGSILYYDPRYPGKYVSGGLYPWRIILSDLPA